MLLSPAGGDRQKKCPHKAGINPFLGGDGGDKVLFSSYRLCTATLFFISGLLSA
jgi:hypothetical protein